tara:strand:+ start:4546 stop:5262 length:717 start_codon:yes stop_codon:yes gene_type:complete
MGTLTGTNIIDRARYVLQDSSGVRWTDAELLDYINDSQREIVNIKPEATATHANVLLAAGTEQTLPSGGLRLIKITRNMSGSAADATGSKSIRIVEEDLLNSIEPDWHDPTVTGASAHGSVIKNYIFDGDDPKKFYVYPGVKSGSSAYVELIYSKLPTNLSAVSSTIDIEDTYGNAILNFVLYRSYLKDAEYAGNQQRAGSHYQLFLNSLGAGGSAEAFLDPNADRNAGPTVAPQVGA